MSGIDQDSLQPDTVRQLLREGLNRGQVIKFLVTSRSMTPFLKPGDHVFLEQVNPKGLQRGDLLVIDDNKELVIHRLIFINPNEQVCTKGDNLLSLDLPITAANILGKVVRIERDRKLIDLTAPLWSRTNWLLGSLGLMESKFVSSILRNPGKNLDHRKDPGQKIPSNWKKEDQDRSRIVSRILAMPFRFLTHIILWVTQSAS